MVASRKPASSGKKSAVGQERRNIYAGVWRAIKHATEQGCWLEVIALCESVIADRLEARIAHLGRQTDKARKIRTANQSANQLLLEISLSDGDRQLLDQVKAWSKERNAAVHQLAKVIDGTSSSWEERWQVARETAEFGATLARSIARWTKAGNKISA